MKKVIAVCAVVCMVLTVFSACKKTEIEVKASEKILSHFSDCMGPDEILDEVSSIDFNHQIDKTGLVETKTEDRVNDTAMIYYCDKNGSVVYEEFEGFGEQGFIYHTESKSGEPLRVHYSFGCYEDESARDVYIKSDRYNIDFNRTDPSEQYGAKSVYATAFGKEYGLIRESITYRYGDEGADGWIASAYYLDEDGMHSYDQYPNGEGVLEDFDDFLFRRNDDVKTTDIQSMTDYFGGDVYQLEMKISGAPFYAETDGKVKWYYDGDLSFIFGTLEGANAFSEKFGGEIDIRSDDEGEEYYTVVVENTGLPIADDAKDFDPYDYIDINDWYSVVPHFNGNWELTGKSSGMISYY